MADHLARGDAAHFTTGRQIAIGGQTIKESSRELIPCARCVNGNNLINRHIHALAIANGADPIT